MSQIAVVRRCSILAIVRARHRRRLHASSIRELLVKNPGDVRRRPWSSALTTVLFAARPRHGRRATWASPSRSSSGCGSPCCSPTSPKPWPKAAARRRPTRCARSRTETQAKLPGRRSRPAFELVPGTEPQGRRHRAGRSRRHHPVRRRGDRGRRLGQRSGHHRRVRAR